MALPPARIVRSRDLHLPWGRTTDTLCPAFLRVYQAI